MGIKVRTPIKNQMIQLSPTMPVIHASKLVWACIGDLATDKAVFEMVSRNKKSVKVANWLICNSAFELKSAAFSLFPWDSCRVVMAGLSGNVFYAAFFSHFFNSSNTVKIVQQFLDILPIGPLFSTNRHRKSAGSF
ncbi:hypothetical protein HYC85_005939 [Camellia sinensis]|uniref:Uncharacterized protein n=1 Tax=Camellia sinensis TaxID=4442 RepID=A0A7J7I2Q9_CAMSI|nr:hypothetical protein HYC85_005939 [Camellia sinensis]